MERLWRNCGARPNDVMTDYEVGITYQWNDNILGIGFNSRYDCENFVIYCVYAPPECSKYTGENDELFNNLTIETYRHNDMDRIFICGDFNARVGNKKDVNDWDEVGARSPVDDGVNRQGERMLTMINDIRGCIINGRINPENDGFTSVTSHKGSAVVDYFITRQSDLSAVREFDVANSIDLIDKQNVREELNEQCRIPDHNLLQCIFETSTSVNESLCGSTLGSKTVLKGNILRKTGANYMNSDVALKMLPTLLNNLAQASINQDDLNVCYVKLTDFILGEANRSIPPSKGRCETTNYKEYWDDELTKKWKYMKECERLYRLSKVER